MSSPALLTLLDPNNVNRFNVDAIGNVSLPGNLSVTGSDY
jgi:hypothetical protein